MQVTRIHHITAVSSDPKTTHHFYSHILGLRLVKKSVNQDDIKTYHLFFGNKLGSPGMDLTFFPFQPAHKGHRGAGLVTTISLAVPEGSLEFWQNRFRANNVRHETSEAKSDEPTLTFYDEDGQHLELIEVAEFETTFEKNVWTPPQISQQDAIRCFHRATLSVDNAEGIQKVLKILGFNQDPAKEEIWKLSGIPNAAQIQINQVSDDSPGVLGAGVVHHIAFGVPDKTTQLAYREKLLESGLAPTPIIDRFYFQSIYFRVPGGILFEIATEGPGFTADEAEKTLGTKLALPPFLEEERQAIEAQLPTLIATQ